MSGKNRQNLKKKKNTLTTEREMHAQKSLRKSYRISNLFENIELSMKIVILKICECHIFYFLLLKLSFFDRSLSIRFAASLCIKKYSTIQQPSHQFCSNL